MVKLRSQKILGEQNVIAQKQLDRRNRKVLKMATAIWLVFMLCWLPWSIFNLSLNHITPGQIPCGFFIYWNIAWFISASYSALNPLTCFLFKANYREGLKPWESLRDFWSVPILHHRTKWFHVTCLRNNMLNYFFFIFSVFRWDKNEIVVWFFERRPCILQNAMVKKPFSLSNKNLSKTVCFSMSVL